MELSFKQNVQSGAHCLTISWGSDEPPESSQSPWLWIAHGTLAVAGQSFQGSGSESSFEGYPSHKRGMEEAPENFWDPHKAQKCSEEQGKRRGVDLGPGSCRDQRSCNQQ